MELNVIVYLQQQQNSKATIKKPLATPNKSNSNEKTSENAGLESKEDDGSDYDVYFASGGVARESPGNIKYSQVIESQELAENNYVSPEDDYHVHIGSKEYFELLFDENKFNELYVKN